MGDVHLEDIRHVGVYETPAAGAEGKTVRIELFAGELTGVPRPQAEIKEVVWFGPEDNPALLAPSLRDVIFPDLRRRGLAVI